MNQPRSRWLQLPGTVMRYQRQGSGQPVLVLLHELGGTLESWDDVIEALPYQNGTILRYDQRSCGLSQRHMEALSIEDLVADLDGLLDAEGISEPVTLVGVAFGAAIALQYAADRPQRVASILAIAPAVGVSQDRKAGVLARADDIERFGAGHQIDERLAMPYPLVLRTHPARFAEFRARRIAGSGQAIAAALRLLTKLDLTVDTLPRIRCPSLIVAGEHDGERPPSGVQASARPLPGAKFEVLESGHFMHWQTPELLARRIDSFLQLTCSEAQNRTRQAAQPESAAFE